MAFSYYDGGQPREALTDRQDKMKIEQLPTLVEMISYTFYCQQYALGVFFEYRDFIAWIEERNEYKKVPSPVIESLKYAGYAFACLGTFSVGAGLFPIPYCYTEEFANETTLAYKLYYIFFAGHFVHYFYYIAFQF